ncbi:MAG: WYL domain-containing protein, partial [Anaerolineae bacterium]|nr:WYL domain-containing protein [Anaerolineae bacterium]
GWVTACVDFQAMDYAGDTILSFGPRVEVLEPAELRAHVRELAAATAAMYGDGA